LPSFAEAYVSTKFGTPVYSLYPEYGISGGQSAVSPEQPISPQDVFKNIRGNAPQSSTPVQPSSGQGNKTMRFDARGNLIQ
jgi:hypothetical protein